MCWSCFAHLLLAEPAQDLLLMAAPCWNCLVLEVPGLQPQIRKEQIQIQVALEVVP